MNPTETEPLDVSFVEIDYDPSDSIALSPLIEDDGPATETDADGWITDLATEQVIGHKDATEAFTVRTPEDADWVLRKRMELDGQLASLDLQLAAFIRHVEAKKREINKRIDWWDFRFRTTLVDFARTCLRGKSKTAQFLFGRVSWTKGRGSNQIIKGQEDEALEWAYTWAPSKIQVRRWITCSDVLAAKQEAERTTGEEMHLPFIATTPGAEKVTITTGIKGER